MDGNVCFMDENKCFMDENFWSMDENLCFMDEKWLFYGWEMSVLCQIYRWESLIYGWKIAAQGQPGAGQGDQAEPERGQSVGTWVGACVGPNRLGTSKGPACRRYWSKGSFYGWKFHFMDEKSILWIITTFHGWIRHFYGWKRQIFWVMDQNGFLWMKRPKLWKIKNTSRE